MQGKTIGPKSDVSLLIERFGHFNPHTGLGDIQSACFGKLFLAGAVFPRYFDQFLGRDSLIAPGAALFSH